MRLFSLKIVSLILNINRFDKKFIKDLHKYIDLTNKQRDLKSKIKECKNFIKHINK